MAIIKQPTRLEVSIESKEKKEDKRKAAEEKKQFQEQLNKIMESAKMPRI